MRRRTRPARSSSRMCFDTEFSEMSKGAATSVTRASPAASWRRILRRVSSARAIRVSSSCMTLYSPIWVNMSSGPGPGRERRRHGAEERGNQAGAELAELVRAADEEHMDGADAAAHVLGRGELHHGGAHEDAHRIRRAHRGERDESDPEIAAERKGDR